MADKKELRAAFVKQFTTLVTTAFGLVAALAWNGAIQNLFQGIFGTASETAALFSYAIIVTIIAVVVIFYVSRLAERLGK